MSEIENLNRRRGALKAKTTRFSQFLEQLQNKSEIIDVDLIQLSDRLDKFEIVIDEFEEIQNLIESSSDNLEGQNTERELFENNYYSQVAKAKKILREKTPEDAKEMHSENSGFGQGCQFGHVKLPTIQLPKFDGSHQDWLEFRDTYESLIHSSMTINEIQKFHYLRAALEGSAAQVIKSLEFTSRNYQIAWKTLVERYNNTRLLVHNHVKELFGIESVQSESAEKLRKMLDTVSKNLRALDQLGQPTSEWDTLVVYLVTTKLDTVTAREWEHYKADKEVPTLDDLKSFLKARADLLETLEQTESKKRQNKGRASTKGFFTIADNQSATKCIVCNKEHYIQNCEDFLKLSVKERTDKTKSMKLCLNCLKRGHYSKNCRRSTCKKCHSKHHTLLHHDKDAKSESTELVESTDALATSSVTLSSYNATTQVLLSTAYVQVLDKDRNAQTVRALLDSGSQSSFITSDLCKRLRLPIVKVDLAVMGLNHISSNIESKCEVKMQSLHNAFETQVSCLVLREITGNLPQAHLSPTDVNIPANIKLADPSFCKPGRVDLLLGADIFWHLICIGQISLGPNKPILQKTRFGWIVSGPIGKLQPKRILCNFSRNLDIQSQLSRFWEIEECSPVNPLSKEEIACEAHFLENTRRDDNGRFIVALPLKGPVESLGDSYDNARRRFLSLERRLESNVDLKGRYQEFMLEYKALNHMTKVENLDRVAVSYYMPHHGVLREESLTTKLRVVFDASSPTTTGLSLNNLQLVGPTIQNDLFSILLRFRQHTFVISGDIAKMYRQILITPEQRCLQRIMWRESATDPLDVYELNTVTYGTTAAAFLAIRCLFQLAQENRQACPEIANIIESDFYVDDLLTGADSVEEAAIIARQVSDILKQGCFELRKFYSNNPESLKYVAEADSPSKIIEFGKNENAKTLGLTWCPTSDSLMYNISQPLEKEKISKRTVLSSISQVFDPLGLLSPCLIIAKIILQRLWLEKVSWDEALPSSLHTLWSEFRTELPSLNHLRINRHVVCINPQRIEMHGFADASESAYGACIFIRSINQNQRIFVNLLCSKTKVAPLKTITLPRLELSAALILARLADKVSKSLRLNFNARIFWSDSTVVLGWLKLPPNRLKTFVSNRVAEIQELTDADAWRHVPSGDNPADILSRGVKPSRIKNLSLWWHGPSWLSEGQLSWPNKVKIEPNKTQELPDMRKNIQSFVCATDSLDSLFDRFSSFQKLTRTVALMLRFQNNCQGSKEARKLGPLTTTEYNNALNKLIKVAQRESFQEELKCVSKNKPIERNSKILSLNPFIDHDGIMRVGGRLEHAPYSFNKKHPIIISSKHQFTKLLFASEHLRLLHAGPQHLLSTIREKFWPTAGRNLAKKTVHQCIKCFRYNPKLSRPIMGNLPEQRLTSRIPFNVTGVDYAGPYLIKDKPGRGSKTSKAYVCLFICFVTKAIHLELVTSLTKDAFVLSLRRFVARRGAPASIFSDNGTNFVSANSELKDLGEFIAKNETDLTNSLPKEHINWKFIPPHSPHFGGLWEAGVKSMKHHLKRVLGNTYLTFEQFYTLLVQVESILNSRPLSPLSSSPFDLSPLTPSHFLVGKPLTDVPDTDLRPISENRLSVFQHVQQMKQHFWSRWNKEYVSELQQRQKWKQSQDTLKEGSLVIIKEDNLAPLQWKLGRVVSLHPGTDGISRVATLRTTSGLTKRAFSKICPLPLEEASS